MPVDELRVDELRAIAEPVLASLDLDPYDVTVDGSGMDGVVRVTVDRDGGIDLDAITAATEALLAAFDAAGVERRRYALEVSSPGLERSLRSPAHFRRAVGASVSVKARVEGETHRWRGVLAAVDDAGITLDVDGTTVRVDLDAVVQARTVFEWGAAPKPDGHKRGKKRANKNPNKNLRANKKAAAR